MRAFKMGEVKGVLVRLDDGWYATSDVCPHAQAPLHEGALCGKRLVCPWHQSVFDVTTGALLEPPALDGLDRYEVRVEGDGIYIKLPGVRVAAGLGTQSNPCRTVVIVGAGAAGQVAAETLRREGFDGRVVLIGREPGSPYDRTNLTKHFLSGKAKREDLPLRREPGFWDGINVERKTTTVTRLDGPAKTATCDDGEVIVYDAAIVATGGAPKPLGRTWLRRSSRLPAADDRGRGTLAGVATGKRRAGGGDWRKFHRDGSGFQSYPARGKCHGRLAGRGSV